MDLAELARAAPVQPIDLPEFTRCGAELALWRLDLIDAAAPGNKLFKLFENLRAARAAGCNRLLSFGGAFSNHIHALALTGAAAGFETVGVIRGEPAGADNPTLRDAAAAGMALHFVDREAYRRRDTEAMRAELQARFGPCFILPEGGSNRLGALGCRIIGEQIRTWPRRPDVVALPCGTGTTLAGIAAGLEDCCETLGIAVLKGDFLADAVRAQLRELGADCRRWRIDGRHHGGGYARVSAELTRFIDRMGLSTGVALQLEPVYSGKMLYALCSAAANGEFAAGTRVLALHTGGLQGLRGFGYRQREVKERGSGTSDNKKIDSEQCRMAPAPTA